MIWTHVWLELQLWCAVVRDFCPLEQSKCNERYRAQSTLMSAQRFKSGVNLCLRMLEKYSGDAAVETKCIDHLHEQGYSILAAKECLSASVNLRDALVRSMDETELERFDAERANYVANWSKNIALESNDRRATL